MEIELGKRGVPFESQQELPVVYKGYTLKKHYVADMAAYGSIIVELKAIGRLTGSEEAQLLNYLKATGKKCGLLINFGATKLEWKRMVL